MAKGLEDSESDAKLKKALAAKLAGIDVDGMRDEQGDIRPSGRTDEAGRTA